MGNFDKKIEKFLEIFIDQNGYKTVIEGLQNTLMIAIVGLIVGIVIGTLIATVRVLPKYKTLPKVLNGICTFYVETFRGTPILHVLSFLFKIASTSSTVLQSSNSVLLDGTINFCCAL